MRHADLSPRVDIDNACLSSAQQMSFDILYRLSGPLRWQPLLATHEFQSQAIWQRPASSSSSSSDYIMRRHIQLTACCVVTKLRVGCGQPLPDQEPNDTKVAKPTSIKLIVGLSPSEAAPAEAPAIPPPPAAPILQPDNVRVIVVGPPDDAPPSAAPPIPPPPAAPDAPQPASTEGASPAEPSSKQD